MRTLRRRGGGRPVPPRNLPPQFEQPLARGPAPWDQPGPSRSRRWTTLGTPKGTRRHHLRSLTAMSRFDFQRVARSLPPYTRWVLGTVQLAIVAVAGVLAFLLRFDFSVPPQYWPHLLAALCVWVPVKVLVFHFLRLDRGWWRYVSIRDAARLAAANLAGSVFGCLALLGLGPEGFPRSIYALDFVVCLGMTAGARVTVRLAFEFSRLPSLGAKKRTLIYGAGDAGVTLLREIRQNPALAYQIVGFIDDAPAKAGRFIHGERVFGNGAALPSIVASQTIETVLIALPSATGAQMTLVLNRCRDAGVSYKTVPF